MTKLSKKREYKRRGKYLTHHRPKNRKRTEMSSHHLVIQVRKKSLLTTVDAMSIFDGVPTPQFVDVLPLYKRPMFPGTMVPIVVSDRQLASRAIKAGAADQRTKLDA